MSEQIYPGPSQMTRIDGDKVRSLREAKGLTQLYIATVVGVTTDTISRWENKRYPSIKEENARKLAEALEVPVDDILEKEAEVSQTETTPIESIPPPKRQKTTRPLIWLLPLALVLLLPFIWNHFSRKPEPVYISATRILPHQTPAGQPFPVIIKVETKLEPPASLILREALPPGCKPIVSAPPFTGIDSKTGHLKWIVRTTGKVMTFVYLAKMDGTGMKASGETLLHFSGSVTLRVKDSPETSIGGAQSLPVANYHWADANRDNRIEDEEILAAYDTFGALDNVNYDWQEIDDIWSGEGYYWDSVAGKFIIRQ